MRMVSPTGGIVDAQDEAVSRLKASGFKPIETETKKPPVKKRTTRKSAQKN